MRKRCIIRVVFGLVILAGLNACGWQLRGMESSPNSNLTGFHKNGFPNTLKIISKQNFSPFMTELVEAMRVYSIEGSPDALAVLSVEKEVLKKRTVAVTSIGSAAQYELKISISYTYSKNGESEALERKTLQAQRIFDFEPGNNIAKTEEETTLLKEMRQELAQRILLQSRNVSFN